MMHSDVIFLVFWITMAISKLFLLKQFLRFKHNFLKHMILTMSMTRGSFAICFDKRQKTNHKEPMQPTI